MPRDEFGEAYALAVQAERYIPDDPMLRKFWSEISRSISINTTPPLLPRMLTKPRTVCGCQPVAFMISGSVAPFARFIIAITSAFLLVRSAFGLVAAFLARPAFFAGLAFLPALLAPFAFSLSGAHFL